MRTRTVFLSLLALCLSFAPVVFAAGNDDCAGCHEDTSLTRAGGKSSVYIDPLKYAKTSHASQVGCTSCHDADTATHPDKVPAVKKPECKECHSEIADVYAKSVHAGNSQCTECHTPHNVRRPIMVSGDDINNQCFKCHDADPILEKHEAWLPSADFHFDTVPCVTCHSDAKDFVITFFPQVKDTQNPIKDYLMMTNDNFVTLLGNGNVGGPLAERFDTDKNGSVSLKELRAFYASKPKDVRLWGQMMPEKVVHDFKLLPDRRDCSFCHLSGPTARQTSFVAIPEKDGSYTRIPIDNGAVLDFIAFGVPDFYMVGATRNLLLSIFGGLLIVGGMCFPLLHGSLRFLTRKNREKKEVH